MRYAPMLASHATVADVPGRWLLEYKWDGMRLLLERHDHGLVLFSRNGVDATERFPELHGLADRVPVGTVLDGEVVAFDEATGQPSFARLQRRMHVSNADTARRAATEVPVGLMVFDLLALGDQDLLNQPLTTRRERLTALGLGSSGGSDPWRVPPSAPGNLADLLATASNHGIEGVVAKDPAGTYQPGERSPSWRKIKVRQRQAFVVAGWLEGSDGAPLGSLLLGYHDAEGSLRWAGTVGSGLSTETAAALHATFVQMEQPELALVDCSLDEAGTREGRWAPSRTPGSDGPRVAHAVAPTLVVEVEFAEWTPQGRLRHPVFKGARMDKAPAEVTRTT